MMEKQSCSLFASSSRSTSGHSACGDVGSGCPASRHFDPGRCLHHVSHGAANHSRERHEHRPAPCRYFISAAAAAAFILALTSTSSFIFAISSAISSACPSACSQQRWWFLFFDDCWIALLDRGPVELRIGRQAIPALRFRRVVCGHSRGSRNLMPARHERHPQHGHQARQLWLCQAAAIRLGAVPPGGACLCLDSVHETRPSFFGKQHALGFFCTLY